MASKVLIDQNKLRRQREEELLRQQEEQRAAREQMARQRAHNNQSVSTYLSYEDRRRMFGTMPSQQVNNTMSAGRKGFGKQLAIKEERDDLIAGGVINVKGVSPTELKRVEKSLRDYARNKGEAQRAEGIDLQAESHAVEEQKRLRQLKAADKLGGIVDPLSQIPEDDYDMLP